MQTNPWKGHTPPPSLRGGLTIWATVHLPSSPPGQVPDSEDSPCTQDLLELFTPAHPNPAQPASPLPSCENHNKGSCLSVPLSLNQPWCFPHVTLHGVVCSLLLGTVRNPLFSMSVAPSLLASPYLNQNKSCISEQPSPSRHLSCDGHGLW